MNRDWDVLRARLARAGARMDSVGTMSAEQARATMDARAAALAGAARPGQAPRELIEVLVFALADERYAVESRFVRTIARLHEYASLPAAPAHFFGLTAVRGELVLILDLRRLLHVGTPGLNDMCRLVVLGVERAEFAILADEVHEIGPLPLDEVRPPPDFVSGAGRDYLRGITESALLVLDGQKLLGDQNLYLDEGREL